MSVIFCVSICPKLSAWAVCLSLSEAAARVVAVVGGVAATVGRSVAFQTSPFVCTPASLRTTRLNMVPFAFATRCRTRRVSRTSELWYNLEVGGQARFIL